MSDRKRRKAVVSEVVEVITTLRDHFDKEKQQGQPIEINNVNKRLSMATGYSISSIKSMKRKLEESNNSNAETIWRSSSQLETRNRESVIPEEFYGLIRRMVLQMYRNKQRPTIKNMVESIKEQSASGIPWTWSRMTLWRALRKMGFRWRKTSTHHDVVVESLSVGLQRVQFIRQMRELRSTGATIFYADEAVFTRELPAVPTAPSTPMTPANANVNTSTASIPVPASDSVHPPEIPPPVSGPVPPSAPPVSVASHSVNPDVPQAIPPPPEQQQQPEQPQHHQHHHMDGPPPHEPTDVGASSTHHDPNDLHQPQHGHEHQPQHGHEHQPHHLGDHQHQAGQQQVNGAPGPDVAPPAPAPAHHNHNHDSGAPPPVPTQAPPPQVPNAHDNSMVLPPTTIASAPMTPISHLPARMTSSTPSSSAKKKHERIIVAQIASNKTGLLHDTGILIQSKRQGEYHADMNSNVFMKWMREKILPYLASQERPVLVLDKASCHTAIVPGSQTPTSSMSKEALAQWLVHHQVPPTERTVEEWMSSHHRIELLALCKNYVPDAKYELVEEAKRHGVSILFIPDSHPELNPMSSCWYHVRANIRAQQYGDLSQVVVNSMADCTADRVNQFEADVQAIEEEYMEEREDQGIPVASDEEADSAVE